MKLPFASDLPPWIRAIGRHVMSQERRERVAEAIDRVAHLQDLRNPDYRRSRSALAALKDRHLNETCVVIGNGPSLRGLDLRELGFARTFCLNRGYLMWQEQGLTPDYYAAINQLVIDQFHREIATVPCPRFLPWRHHRLFPADDDRSVFVEMRLEPRFFRDVTSGLWAGATVTAAALQLAFHMGFARVVLIGVDHRYATTGTPHAEVVQRSGDESHFSAEYFGKGVRWNLPDLETSEIAYRMARDAFAEAGREIVDATVGGALTVFPKTTLAEVAEKVRAEQAQKRAPGVT